jgi:hypothetical protein
MKDCRAKRRFVADGRRPCGMGRAYDACSRLPGDAHNGLQSLPGKGCEHDVPERSHNKSDGDSKSCEQRAAEWLLLSRALRMEQGKPSDGGTRHTLSSLRSRTIRNYASLNEQFMKAVFILQPTPSQWGVSYGRSSGRFLRGHAAAAHCNGRSPCVLPLSPAAALMPGVRRRPVSSPRREPAGRWDARGRPGRRHRRGAGTPSRPMCR